MELNVSVTYDEEAQVWVAENDILGLVTEAATMEALTYKLQEMISELVDLNTIDVPHPVAFTVFCRRPAIAFA